MFAQALAHRSWCAEHPGKEPNERLEFLGDAVLGLIVTDYLYRSYPDLPEGELAKARAAVVNSASLASAARQAAAGQRALLLGKGEDSSGGGSKLSILADAMEAVIGAIYLDAGYARDRGYRPAPLRGAADGMRPKGRATRTTRPGSRSCALRPTTSCPSTA